MHGKNEGYKNDEITKIKRKLGKKITTYDEKQILDNFKNKFYPSVDKLLANHIELTIHEEFLREQMTKSTEKK